MCNNFIFLSYKKNLKTWRIRSRDEEAKRIYDETVEEVKRRFKDELSLLIDLPKDSGAGTTNSGDVARRAFANPAITADICGVSENLVKRTHNIWVALAQPYDLDPDQLEKYCEETYQMYLVELEDPNSDAAWYFLPQSVHKVWAHSAEFIRQSKIPPGLTSEEALEASHKLAKKIRTHFAKKTSPHDTLEDVFNRMSELSDPIMLNLGAKYRKTKMSAPLPDDVTQMLLAPVEQSTMFSPSSDQDED